MESYFGGIATLIAALAAVGIYVRRRRDNKRDAAKVLLIEITEAEDALNAFKVALAKGEKNIPDDSVLTSNSWEKYKYLFINDFTAREWTRVTDFYKNCEKLDEAILLNQSFFGKNEQAIREVLYQSFGKFLHTELENAKDGAYSVTMPDGSVKLAEDAVEQFKKNVGSNISMFPKLYIDMIRENQGHYTPEKPINDCTALMGYIDTSVSDSEIATKLKKFARQKKTSSI